MNAFRLLRLVLWGIVLAACLVVVALNYAVSRSTSSQDVQAIADEADAYTTIRQQLIAPKLLAAAKTTDYSTLVDAELIDSALSDSFSEQQLKKLLRPATESLALWLDSRRPDATFSVDASSQLAEFRSSFTTQLSARYMALPDCTYLNTYEDAQRLVCKSPYVTEEDVLSLIHI